MKRSTTLIACNALINVLIKTQNWNQKPRNSVSGILTDAMLIQNHGSENAIDVKIIICNNNENDKEQQITIPLTNASKIEKTQHHHHEIIPPSQSRWINSMHELKDRRRQRNRNIEINEQITCFHKHPNADMSQPAHVHCPWYSCRRRHPAAAARSSCDH